MKMTIFVFILFACVTTNAATVFYTGNDLAGLMREFDKGVQGESSAVDWVMARDFSAYIVGVYDATRNNYTVNSNVTKGQIVLVVSKYIKDNPEKWNQPADVLIKEALKIAFP